MSAETGVDIHLFLLQGCSYLDLIRPMRTSSQPGCVEFIQTVTRKVLESARAGDVVFLPSLRLRRYGVPWEDYGIRDLHHHMYNPGAAVDRTAALEEARTWLLPFREKQLHVVFMAPPPLFRAPAFRCADWFNRMNPICAGDTQVSRMEMERVRAPVLAAMQELAAEIGEISIWDPFPDLCPAEMCSAFRDGRPLFIDGDHVSGYGNIVLYPSLRAMLLRERQ